MCNGKMKIEKICGPNARNERKRVQNDDVKWNENPRQDGKCRGENKT